ncbi:DUF2971 domain-containing protein [Sinorhizobium meliloti]|nr:DUF2971 domain-containing protein [Sinorhizobium meliloti]MDX0275810.1 DUF2971 domain-containing protein [Sinorhizobium meliloti]
MSNIRLTAISDSIGATYGRIEKVNGGPIFKGGDIDTNLICSRCSTVVGENTGIIRRLVNAAAVCPGCGVTLNLSKESPYSQSVRMLRDLESEDLRVPTKAFDLYPPDEDNNARFATLHERATRAWNLAQGTAPQVLYHYTTGSGLAGILQTSSLWVSDISFLNDSSEFLYASEMVRDIIEESLRGASPMARLMLERTTIATPADEPTIGYFAACFCTDGDLLSQWRAYGGHTDGYSIGFDTRRLIEDEMPLRKIIYDPTQQELMIRETIDAIVDLMNAEFGNIEVTPEKLGPYSEYLRKTLLEYILSFKHPSFVEENEWRIVLPIRRDAFLDSIQFRNSSGRLVPYLELRTNAKGDSRPPLPILSLRQGPTTSPVLNKKSVQLMLLKHNYDHVDVFGSDTPLRV